MSYTIINKTHVRVGTQLYRIHHWQLMLPMIVRIWLATHRNSQWVK